MFLLLVNDKTISNPYFKTSAHVLANSMNFSYCYTVVWKIFLLELKMFERIIFVVYQHPRKYFNNEIELLVV